MRVRSSGALVHFLEPNLCCSSRLTSLLRVSPQRIFNSFVYTEKTSNGETEVQQVSNKGFPFALCACECVCIHVHRAARARVSWIVCVCVCTLPLNGTHSRPSEERTGFIKILQPLSHRPWSSVFFPQCLCTPASSLPPPTVFFFVLAQNLAACKMWGLLDEYHLVRNWGYLFCVTLKPAVKMSLGLEKLR